MILPIIFYEDDRNWTADPCLKDRIAFGDLFGRYIPDFEYRLVRIYDNSPEDILKHNDEFSMMMALMQIMGLKDIEVLNDKKKQMSDVYKNSSHEIRSIASQLIEYIMRKMEFSEEEVQDVISCVEEKKVERLFEYSHVANNMRILREKSAKYDEMSAKYEDMSERYNSVILDFNDAEERLRKAENAVQVERKLREEKEELAVCNMLADGISHDKISEYTGMPVEKIRQLADKL